MKKLALALTLLAAAPLAASADVTKDDIKKLAAAGVGEEVILTFIRTHGPVTRLSADDLVELKQAGATEKVLAAMVGEPGAAPAPRFQQQAVERAVTAPSTTYVVGSPAYTSYDYYSYPYFSYYWPAYYYSSCYPRYSYSCYPRYGYSYYYPRYGFSYSYGRSSPRYGISARW